MALTGDMFLQKIVETLKGLPNALGIVDDILIVGHDADGRAENRTHLRLLMQLC